MTSTVIPPLISVRAAADQLAAAPPVLLDVRWVVGSPALRADYLTAHIPGAQWCDLDADLADPPGTRGRHPLPDPARLQARMREWGLDDDSSVIVYDGAESVAAARAWWVLRWAGLERVQVLDGGFAAWVTDDQPVETGAGSPPARPGQVTIRPGSVPALDADSAAGLAVAGRLIDVRAPERFRGEVEPMDPVAGRIPGAVNLPTTGNVTTDGRFKPAVALRARLTETGVDGDEPVGVYCGSGVTAAHTMLALAVAGQPAVLYPGSWSEWITDPTRGVETGPATAPD